MVTHSSTDTNARTATFNVDGETVVRGIASHISASTLDAHIQDLLTGLEAEVELAAAVKPPLV